MIPIIILAIENDDDRQFMIDLYIKYSGMMQSVAISILHDDAEAEDTVQDALEQLIMKIDKIKNFQCYILTSYIVSTIRRVSLNRYNKRKRVKEHETLDDGEALDMIEDEKDVVEEKVLKTLTAEALMFSLEKLPERYKDALNFKYLLDMEDEEIAEAMGISKDSVRTLLMRARRKALSIIEKEKAAYAG